MVVLCILDGIGWGNRDEMDAVYQANTPHLDRLMHTYPWGLLQAHGTAVGLPSDDDMGNSEVGHNAMGAGRVFAQGATLVQNAIQSGTMWQSASWKEAVHIAKNGKTLHLLGLLSDGNVHSHIDHAIAMVQRADIEEISQVCLHILTDGRDVSPRSALAYIEKMETILATINTKGNRFYQIASGGGRMWMTMDRYEADWDMVQRGWNCHVLAQGRRFLHATDAVSTLYSENPKMDDQWLPAFVLGDYQGMQDGDAVILFNFRGDRAIEISKAFEDKSISTMQRGNISLFFAGMMEYDGDTHIPSRYLVPPPQISTTVGDILSKAKKTVFSISETQKFGHVTFFFNGNRSGALDGETQYEIPSFNVPCNQKPEMKAEDICGVVISAIQSGQYDHIRCNFANGDMVGHTGDFEATKLAVEIVDACVGKLAQACIEHNALLLITADHGNADEMAQWDKKAKKYKKNADGSFVVSTSHSLNPVPCILLDPSNTWTLIGEKEQQLGGLAQIGATILHLCGLEIPSSYLPSLVQKQ